MLHAVAPSRGFPACYMQCAVSRVSRMLHLVYLRILHHWEIGQNTRWRQTCVMTNTCVMTSHVRHSKRGSVISDCLVSYAIVHHVSASPPLTKETYRAQIAIEPGRRWAVAQIHHMYDGAEQRTACNNKPQGPDEAPHTRYYTPL